MRMVLVSRIYGWKFALGTPFRMLLSTCLNAFATAGAIRTYVVARWRRKRLSWLKTEHAFPGQVATTAPKMMVFAASVGSGTIAETTQRLDIPATSDALDAGPRGMATAQGTDSVAALGRGEIRPPRTAARPLSLQDDEVIVAIPRNLPPWEREYLMRRKTARLVFVEEDEPIDTEEAL